ncbi:orotate phosphoribosyltransferase [Marinilactibacillus kalidii]|uniref:orotate phosphoribosyltransferase n=1 Tax=Marinilactibacillus kalidii TaxID=2820274 RepID=UPI001ABEAE53|nr:orotate phosphoribosyltransferase [Marinilactibacillus kalidii]
MTNSSKISEDLLSIGAISVQPNDPFTWTSGMKSPIYCDNRITMSYPEIRKRIVAAFVEIIQKNYPDVEVIAGTATAGIPHAAWIAQSLDLPMVYIRSSAKKHGKGKQIEGTFSPGAKMVIVEDLVSTGSSVINAAQEAINEEADVIGAVAIFTYELAVSANAFKEIALPIHTITSYSNMIHVALEIGKINEKDQMSLIRWKIDPENWQ